MTKADLKDGMVVTYRNGRERVFYAGKFYVFNTDRTLELTASIKNYDDGLLKKDSKVLDIVKVSYMGEVLWVRKEYMTFIEAAKSGKRFKHKDCMSYWWSASIALDYYEKLVEEKSGEEFEGKQAFKQVAEEMEKKVWEVE